MNEKVQNILRTRGKSQTCNKHTKFEYQMGKKDKRAEEIFKVISTRTSKYNKGQTTDLGNTGSTKPDKSPNDKPRRSMSKLQKTEKESKSEKRKYLWRNKIKKYIRFRHPWWSTG